MTLEQLVALCSENPARIFGLYPRKGSLQVGADADIVIVDLDRKETLDAKKMHDVYSYSAYHGRQVKGWPVMTLVRGETVMQDGTITGPPGHGRFLAASLPPGR